MAKTRATLQEKEQVAREIGEMLQSAMPPGVGYALLVFDLGEKGHSTYVSNANRADMITALRECADRLEHKLVAPHGAPGHPSNRPSGEG